MAAAAPAAVLLQLLSLACAPTASAGAHKYVLHLGTYGGSRCVRFGFAGRKVWTFQIYKYQGLHVHIYSHASHSIYNPLSLYENLAYM